MRGKKLMRVRVCVCVGVRACRGRAYACTRSGERVHTRDLISFVTC
jgi:hypothetical protein